MADGGEPARARRIVIRAALAVLLTLAAWHSLSRWFLIDDAFISFRYARHLVEGHGLVFNPGVRVEGYSNFLWTFLCAAAMVAGLAPETAAPAMGMMASLLLLVGLYAWSRDLGLPPGWALVAPAMLAANRSYAGWATGGLETRLFSLLLVALAWRLHAERRGDAADRRPLSAVLAGLACLTRPEGWLAAFIALTGGVLAVRAAAGEGGSAARGRGHRTLALWCAAFAAIAGAHLVWRIIYYGDWLPNSFRAKVPGLRLESGVVYLGLFALHHLAAPLAALGLALPAGFLRLRAAGVSVAKQLSGFALPFCGVYVAYVMLIGGDHFEFRFMDPVLPFLYLSLALLAHRWLAAAGATTARRGWTAAAAILLAASGGPSALAGFDGYDGVLRGRSVSVVSMEAESVYLAYWSRMGQWLARHAGPEESIAVAPAGAIPYYSGLKSLDMLGINDRDLAAMPPIEGLNIGHERMASEATVRARGTTYLIGSPDIRRSRAADWSDDRVEVYFGDFYWYFTVLDPRSKIRPGSYR